MTYDFFFLNLYDQFNENSKVEFEQNRCLKTKINKYLVTDCNIRRWMRNVLMLSYKEETNHEKIVNASNKTNTRGHLTKKMKGRVQICY